MAGVKVKIPGYVIVDGKAVPKPTAKSNRPAQYRAKVRKTWRAVKRG